MAKSARSLSTRALADLVLDDSNPRTHPDRNVGVIVDSIREFGQVEDIIVQRGSLRVIAGHGRIEAMRRLGLKRAEIREIDIDDIGARRLSVILNRSGDLAGWDSEKLQAILDQASELDIEPFALGFTDSELELLIGDAATESDEQPNGPASEEAAPEYQVLIVCPSRREQARLLKRLTSEGLDCRALTT